MNASARLLLVEDEMIVALDLERRLKKLGYDVCGQVPTGEEAVAQVAALKPDLVLMDIMLGGALDGIQAAERIAATADIPVVYVSANADDRTVDRARATHPAGYLLKPFRERELQICIEMSLVNHRLRRELRAAHDGLEQRVHERTAELAQANEALRAEMAARVQAEAQLLRAQRLESIGALASGIAHDLNNVFTPLMMCAQSLEDAAPGSYNAQLADIILNSSRRGAEMVKQILLFVRGAEGDRVPLRAEHLVSEVQKLLRDTLPRSIRLRTHCAPGVRAIVADGTQLHQLLMNLCVNARDAMPHGGELGIELHNVEPGSGFFRDHPEARGAYVRLTVADTGTGMTPEVRAKLFTPFFTTKETGKGTGLGLSTVRSIVQAHQGFIDVESQVGVGTKFVIYLPAGFEAEREIATIEAEPPHGKGEHLLVVDDEAGVREITKATLEAYGYMVVVANDGVDAIAQFAQSGRRIAGVVCDNEMPFLSGAGCVRGIRRIDPSVPVLLVSGSETVADLSAMGGEAPVQRLAKPFTKHQLLHAVHRCLHRDAATTGAA